MIISATGHRPKKLKAYNQEAYPGLFPYERLIDLSTQIIKSREATHVISGMSLGFDMAMAQAAIELEVPFIAAIPFEGQESKWPKESQEYYHKLLEQASEIEFVSNPGYEAWKMQKRNEFMVNNSDVVVALWDGSESGTGNCVDYANSVEKPVINYWDVWEQNKTTIPLSSVEPAKIEYYGIAFPSLENFIQAMRYKDERIRRYIASIEPIKVRQNLYGQIRDDIDLVFYDAVLYGIKEKYIQNPDLKQKLLSTSERHLKHWNIGNNFDAELDIHIETHEGQNILGNALEVIRYELQHDERDSTV